MNTKMICPLQTGRADVLLDYCARSLDAERKAMLEIHMENCAGCREMASAQSQVWSALDAYDAGTASADFDRKLYARIGEMKRVPAFWVPVREYFRGRPAWKPVLSLAAASAVFLVVFVVRGDVAQSVNEPGDATIDVRDVERAERALEDIEMLRQFEVALPAAQKEML